MVGVRTEYNRQLDARLSPALAERSSAFRTPYGQNTFHSEITFSFFFRKRSLNRIADSSLSRNPTQTRMDAREPGRHKQRQNRLVTREKLFCAGNKHAVNLLETRSRTEKNVRSVCKYKSKQLTESRSYSNTVCSQESV